MGSNENGLIELVYTIHAYGVFYIGKERSGNKRCRTF